MCAFTKVITDVLGWDMRRCRTWLGLYLDKKNSFSSESSLSSSRVLKERGEITVPYGLLFDALHQLSGTHYRKLFSVVTLLQFLSLG